MSGSDTAPPFDSLSRCWFWIFSGTTSRDVKRGWERGLSPTLKAASIDFFSATAGFVVRAVPGGGAHGAPGEAQACGGAGGGVTAFRRPRWIESSERKLKLSSFGLSNPNWPRVTAAKRRAERRVS